MTIKSGSGIVEIWQYPISDPENPDIRIEPQHQLDPININIKPVVHEVKTDDSSEPDRRFNKGLKVKITITLSDIGLEIIRGFLPGQSFSGTGKFSVGQNTGVEYSTHQVRILPNPINENDPRWRDSVITLSESHILTDSTALDFGINTQKSWRAIATSTAKSEVTFGYDP